jgi:hypothetical protein
MTKARARERAKANALKKLKKKLSNSNQPEEESHPGQFDHGDASVSGPSGNSDVKNMAGSTRGSARSR